jgi:hypothetical protein
VSGTAGFYVYAYDYRGVRRIELKIDGNLAASYDTQPQSYVAYTFLVDTTKYENGNHPFEVIAVDTGDQVSKPLEILVNIQN